MKHHLAIWTVAAVALIAAAALAVARTGGAARRVNDGAPEVLVSHAIALLTEDPTAWRRETQLALREAASLVERNEVWSAQGYYVLALQFQREDNLAGAEAFFKRAIATDPAWSWPYAGLGNLIGRHTYGRTEEAVAALAKAIDLAPDWGRPHNVLAVVLRGAGRLDKAKAEARRALELSPEDIAAYNNYANLLMELGRYEEAETNYRKAIDLNPEHPKPFYNLACLCSLQDRRSEAVVNLQEAFRRAPILRRDAVFDPDFDPMREDPEFRRLVYGPDETPR